MAVDLLFGNSETSEAQEQFPEHFVPLRMFDTGRSVFAPWKFGKEEKETASGESG
jgi:hypothetical protein